MKKIMMIALVMILGVLGAQAEHEPKTAEERAQIRTDRMKDSLELTDEQTEKIYEINLNAEKKIDEVKAKYKDAEDKLAAKEEIKAINKERRDAILPLLTEEQKKKAKEMNDGKKGHKYKHHKKLNR